MSQRVFSTMRSPSRKTSQFSTVSDEGMFKSRPFVVQAKVGEERKKSDLRTSLMRAQRYGHNLSKISAVAPLVPQTIQQKVGIDKTSPKPELPEKLSEHKQNGVKFHANAQCQPIQLGIVKPATPSKKKKTRRDIALGGTPGKKSRVGREVLERWHSKNKAKWKGPGKPDYKKTAQWEVHVKDKTGNRVWKPLDANIHMGHKLSAVDYWEKGAKDHIKNKYKYRDRYKNYKLAGHKSGFKSKTNRGFMLNSANYRFEYGPVNSSDGAKMKEKYKTLPTGVKKWPDT